MPLVRFPLFRIFEFIFGMYFMAEYNNKSHGKNYLLIAITTIAISVFLSFKFNGNLFLANAILGILLFILLSILSRKFENYIPQKTIIFISKYSYAAFLLHHLILVRTIAYAKKTHLLPDYNYAIFFATVVIIYLFSFILYSSLRSLFRNSISL
jgi:peptidoglycan/LPS O-acetylase OafA/YrhL